jgi:hypothetical protein
MPIHHRNLPRRDAPQGLTCSGASQIPRPHSFRTFPRYSYAATPWQPATRELRPGPRRPARWVREIRFPNPDWRPCQRGRALQLRRRASAHPNHRFVWRAQISRLLGPCGWSSLRHGWEHLLRPDRTHASAQIRAPHHRWPSGRRRAALHKHRDGSARSFPRPAIGDAEGAADELIVANAFAPWTTCGGSKRSLKRVSATTDVGALRAG